MTQEQKELLLKDISARLPYGVWVKDIHTNIIRKLSNIVVHPLYDGNNIKDYICSIKMFDDHYVDIEYIRLFLYPLSSMTEEQANELFDLFGISLLDSIGGDYIKINECTGITFFLNKGFDVETHLDKLLDWLNRNQFDWRNLIEKGLALDATGLNLY